MKDYKFNTNDQQLRGFAMEIANSNAPQGTLPELIMADAEKIVEYVRDGLPPESELGQTIERVQLIRSMQNEQAWKKQELEQRIEQDKIDRAEAEWAAENGIALQLDACEGEVLVEEGALTTETLEEMRTNAIADGALTPEDMEDIRTDAVATEPLTEGERAHRIESRAHERLLERAQAGEDMEAQAGEDMEAPVDAAVAAAVPDAPEQDPEFERLLAEEEAIEREVRERQLLDSVTAETVVKMVERGLTEVEIANELGISVEALRVLWSQFKSEIQEENPPVVTSSSPAERGEAVVLENVQLHGLSANTDGYGAPGVPMNEEALRQERIAAELRARQGN
jgi:hypothetical protein